MSCGTVILDFHSYIVDRYRNSGKNQLFLVETNDKRPFKMIIHYYTRIIKWRVWFVQPTISQRKMLESASNLLHVLTRDVAT